MKLGLKPFVPDTRDFLFSKYRTGAPLPKHPKHFGHEALIKSGAWGMLGNDTVGDCTCAAAGHADQIAETYGAKKKPDVTPEAVLAAYSAITGYDPSDPNSDTGANMLDVLRYWQKTGIAGEKITAYVAAGGSLRKAS